MQTMQPAELFSGCRTHTNDTHCTVLSACRYKYAAVDIRLFEPLNSWTLFAIGYECTMIRSVNNPLLVDTVF